MISYVGPLIQFSPAAGIAGAAGRHRCVCGALPCSGHTGFAPHRGVCAFPVYTAQAPGCSIWSGPCVECGSSFRVLHNSADSVAPVFCVFPGLSGSGSQRLGQHSPRVRCAFSLCGERPGQPEAWRPLPWRGSPFPSAAPARAAGRVSGSLHLGTGACLPGGRGWLLWA